MTCQVQVDTVAPETLRRVQNFIAWYDTNLYVWTILKFCVANTWGFKSERLLTLKISDPTSAHPTANTNSILYVTLILTDVCLNRVNRMLGENLSQTNPRILQKCPRVPLEKCSSIPPPGPHQRERQDERFFLNLHSVRAVKKSSASTELNRTSDIAWVNMTLSARFLTSFSLWDWHPSETY